MIFKLDDRQCCSAVFNYIDCSEEHMSMALQNRRDNRKHTSNSDDVSLQARCGFDLVLIFPKNLAVILDSLNSLYCQNIFLDKNMWSWDLHISNLCS